MKLSEKTKTFMKDVGIAAVAGIAAGVAATEISDLLTDSHAIISASSAMAEVISETAVFGYLYYKDNKNSYWIENKFQTKKFGGDMLKIVLGFRVFDYIYNGAIAPTINYGLQTVGVDHSLSFLIPNLAHLGYHLITAIPIGKTLGLLENPKRYDN